MVSSRPVSTLNYSVEIQKCSDASVTHKYRRWHTLSFYITENCLVHRATSYSNDIHRFKHNEIGIYPAADAEHIVWPDQTHAIHVHINPSLIDVALVKMGFAANYILPRYLSVYDRRLYELGREFLYIDYSSSFDQSQAVQSIIDQICQILAKDYVVLNSNTQINQKQPWIGQLGLDKLLNMMHDHHAISNSVNDLALQTNLSVRQFSTLFNRSIGCSAHDYMVRSRIETAKHLIQTSNLSLTDVALHTGFYDQAHFSKTFKSRIGLTPSQFADAII